MLDCLTIKFLHDILHRISTMLGGGYAAGCYSYLWSEVLAVNIADYFAKHGALTRKVGDDFRNKVLSRGNTMDLMEIFSNFTGLKAQMRLVC